MSTGKRPPFMTKQFAFEEMFGVGRTVDYNERFILTMKQVLAQLPLIPLRRESFRNELTMIIQWYNEHRPHDSLGGKTPNEVYHDRFPASRKPRIEPRAGWPRGSPCAKPQALVAGKQGQRFEMTVDFFRKRRHLPIVTLKRAA